MLSYCQNNGPGDQCYFVHRDALSIRCTLTLVTVNPVIIRCIDTGDELWRSYVFKSYWTALMQNDIGTFIFRRLCRLRQSTAETRKDEWIHFNESTWDNNTCLCCCEPFRLFLRNMANSLCHHGNLIHGWQWVAYNF